jgi:hypothetical protein
VQSLNQLQGIEPDQGSIVKFDVLNTVADIPAWFLDLSLVE